MTFTPCSTRHKSCSPAHADLVTGYRLARYNDEIRHEALLDSRNVGERALAKENGHKLIDFQQWLKAHKRT
jgi:hypothetical protein